MGILWEAAYATAFSIQVSNDNSTWTTVYSTTTGTGGNETFPISATARYIRMYGTVRATQFGYSIFEFDVYGLTTTAAGHRRQRQRRQRHLPWVGSTAPVAQRVQQVLNTMDQSEEVTLALRRRQLVLHRPGQRHPRSVHPADQHGGRPVRGR